MYSNIGWKIKTVAFVFCIIGIIISVLYSFYLFSVAGQIPSVSSYAGYGSHSSSTVSGSPNYIDQGSVYLSAFLILILGPIASWINSLLLFGFGELVENSGILIKKCEMITYKMDDLRNNSGNRTDGNNNPGNKSDEKRIKDLDKLLESGLITEEEYAKKIGERK